jgi:hypothetical protein
MTSTGTILRCGEKTKENHAPEKSLGLARSLLSRESEQSPLYLVREEVIPSFPLPIKVGW